MNGVLGTRIHDDIRTGLMLIDQNNRPYISATVYEQSTYRLTVKLDCGGQDNPCSSSLNIILWIDFNDDRSDHGEKHDLRRSWSVEGTATGEFYLDIYVPPVDGILTKSGLHQMRLSVVPSEEYKTQCGSIDYQETRDYYINVVQKAAPIGKYFSFHHSNFWSL